MESITTKKSDAVPQPNGDNIVVFDISTDASETAKPEAKPEIKNDKVDPNNPDNNLEKKQETVKDELKDKLEPTKTVVNDNDKADEDKSDDKSDNTKLSFEFANTVEDKPNTDKETAKPKQETATVTMESVVGFLQQNGFDGIENISDLSKKETLPEQVEKFKKFHEETNGRGIKDFYNLQKDWNTETAENRIKEYLKLKYTDLDEDQIKTQFDVLNVTEQDEEDLSPRELNRAKAEFDKMDAEAKKFLNQKSKEYETPLGNPKQEANKVSEKDIEKSHEKYWKDRDNSLKKFNDFSFKIKGLGDIKVAIDESDKKIIQDSTRTVNDMISRWSDEKKGLNTDQLILDNAWSNPSLRQKMLVQIAEQVHALTLQNESKARRNVDLDDLNNKSKQKSDNNGALIKIEDKNRPKSNTNYGQPIVQRRN